MLDILTTSAVIGSFASGSSNLSDRHLAVVSGFDRCGVENAPRKYADWDCFDWLSLSNNCNVHIWCGVMMYTRLARQHFQSVRCDWQCWHAMVGSKLYLTTQSLSYHHKLLIYSTHPKNTTLVVY